MTLIEKTLVKNLMKSELESSKTLSKDVQSMLVSHVKIILHNSI